MGITRTAECGQEKLKMEAILLIKSETPWPNLSTNFDFCTCVHCHKLETSYRFSYSDPQIKLNITTVQLPPYCTVTVRCSCWNMGTRSKPALGAFSPLKKRIINGKYCGGFRIVQRRRGYASATKRTRICWARGAVRGYNKRLNKQAGANRGERTFPWSS